MIERWFEAFTLLEKLSAPDGLGGETGGFRPGTPFRAVLTMVPGKEFPMGGQPVLTENPARLSDRLFLPTARFRGRTTRGLPIRGR